MRIKLIIGLLGVFLGLCAYFNFKWRIIAENKLEACEAKKRGLDESNLEANKQIAELRKKAARPVKENCDCYNSRIDDVYLNILHSRESKTE